MVLTDSIINRTIALAKEYGATKLILFGSSVDSPNAMRDLDLACDGVPGWKLYELGAKLEDELNIPIDIVPLSPANRFTQMIEQYGKVLL